VLQYVKLIQHPGIRIHARIVRQQIELVTGDTSDGTALLRVLLGHPTDDVRPLRYASQQALPAGRDARHAKLFLDCERFDAHNIILSQ